MSDIPRTDKHHNQDYYLEDWVPESFAKELERELNAANADITWLRERCRIVLYFPDDRYPIEHAPGANKDQFMAILAERKTP